MSKRNNIGFSKPPEPAFIRRIKEQIGYKEGPNIDTKREVLEIDEDFEEKEDDKPTIVVLKSGDLTQEEAEKLEKDRKEKEGRQL
ncbi:uncharacterized protein KIAA1143 homolog isoform X3 [Artemia franciscana]|uniref:uncharacterized protein KIAA1143 homolog isoform X3 n=1 Tax=Artemia franciscana TaxID=6661 RepID=UPI0032D9EF98